MSRSDTVAGFDYAAGRYVSMTRAEWRTKYPASAFRRRVENEETFYTPIAKSQADRPRLTAEAYANIPEGK